ncbi:MAG: hypothetical protein F4Z09_05850 [Rhodobacteraceae bacterium]|nr:hypothetical protein [Paracoccaceae bacterium]
MELQSQKKLHFHIKSNLDMRVQEEMYGHRLNTDQEGYMILLEALTVINKVPLGTKMPDPTSRSHERIHYTLPYKQRVRYLLFKDQHLAKINNDPLLAQDNKWEAWKRKTKNHFTSLSSLEDHFHYLDEKFDDLDELLQAVRLVQSMELDVMNKRRWTSKFLCITGPDMILPDFRETKGNWTADRRFFGRGGELVYLMLNRSDQRNEVQKLIQERLLSCNDPYNKMVNSLSPTDSYGSSTTEIGYLPYIHHKSYNRLARSWIKILEQKLLTGSHLFDPLFRITGLNLILYLAERSKEITDRSRVEPFLIDLTDGNNYQLRQAARNNLNLHRDLQNDAVKSFITNKIESDKDWETACYMEDGNKAAEVIYKLFDCNVGNSRSYDGISHDEVLKSFINKAQRRSHNNANRYILSLSKQIGICTSRGSLGTWFAMDDLMIIALVMAEVVDTVELGEFLAKLYETYNLVIGPTEARKAYPKIPISNKCFEENLSAMEKRMTKLALTKRLSDDCAFVINPFRSQNA